MAPTVATGLTMTDILTRIEPLMEEHLMEVLLILVMPHRLMHRAIHTVEEVNWIKIKM